MTSRLPQISVTLPDGHNGYWPVLHIDGKDVVLHGINPDAARILGASARLLAALMEEIRLHDEGHLTYDPDLDVALASWQAKRNADRESRAAIAAALPPETNLADMMRPHLQRAEKAEAEAKRVRVSLDRVCSHRWMPNAKVAGDHCYYCQIERATAEGGE